MDRVRAVRGQIRGKNEIATNLYRLPRRFAPRNDACAMTRILGVGLSWIDAEHPQNGFFLVAAVASRIDANGREFAAFAPAFDGKSGNTENGGYFGDGQKIGEVI